MALPLALPLAPVVSSGASAAAVTFVAGSTVKLIDSIYGFRRPTPTLPPITGLEGVATLRELIGDALAGARIPVAMPPSPLGPNGSIAGIAAAAAALGIWNALRSGVSQLWGNLGGRPATDPVAISGLPVDPSSQQEITLTGSGQFSPTGITTITASGLANGERLQGGVLLQVEHVSPPVTTNHVGVVGIFLDKGPPMQSPAGWFSFEVLVQLANGSTAGVGVGVSGGASWQGQSVNISSTTNEVDALNAAPTTNNQLAPLSDRSWFTDAMPQLATGQPFPTVSVPQLAPLITPLKPNPSSTPQTESAPQPETQPQVVPVQPGPSRPAVPAIAPAQPPTIAPWLFPGAIPAAQQTTPAGAVAPLPLPLPQPTPAGNIFPVAGAPPLTEAGPRATIQAIATEVGRIEQKVDRMLNPVPPSNGLDRLGELMALIGRLVEALLSAQSGGTYTMEGPCEVDSSGEPIVDIREVQFPGALTVLGVMVNRLDALAVLLQEHKNLRQPTCRKKAPVGEFVTVNFEQI